MRVISRVEWGAVPAKSVTYFPAPPVGLVVHYVGSSAPMRVDTLDKAKATMRSIQADAFSKGYSDFEYNFAISLTGDVFEGRGKAIQSGANGDQTQNRARWSVVFLTGAGEALTAAAIDAYHALHAWLGGDQIQHCKVAPQGTSCPGDAIKAQWSQVVGTSTSTPVPVPGPSTATPPPVFPAQKGQQMATLQHGDKTWFFTVTSDGKLHHSYWGGSGATKWSDWLIGDGCDPHAPISAIFAPEGSSDWQVFANTTDGRVLHAWWYAPEARIKAEYFYA